MLDKEERDNIIKAVAKHDDHYRNNPEALRSLGEALKEAEAMLNGKLPMKSAREILKELRDEA